MSLTRSIITTQFNTETASRFVESFSTKSSDVYYIFLGKHNPNNTYPTESIEEYTNIYNDMLYSKKVESTDVINMVKNIPWISGKKFDSYSDSDILLKEKDFYTIVDDISEYNVYKCLDNANTVSTIAPSRSGNPTDSFPHITSDGYMWKYMYTIDAINYNKFSTRDHVPLTSNTSIIENTKKGTVDVIRVKDGGANYNNYISQGVLNSGDISIGGDTTLYGAPTTASTINDYYRGCVIRLTSGLGVDQYRRIVGYDGSNIQKKYFLDRAFTIQPSNNDTYEVYPYVYVRGDKNETVSAEGIAYISLSANSISSVFVLNSGLNYRTGNASVGQAPKDIFSTAANNTLVDLSPIITGDVNFKPALLETIISPVYGHGGNPIEELFANKVCLSVKFSQTESGTIPLENDFRQIGIIKNPLFDNVTLYHDESSKIGSFSVGETLGQFKQIKLSGTFTANTSNNQIIKTSQGKLSSSATIISGGTGYTNVANNELVFNNIGTGGSGAIGTFANNASGVITSVTLANQGTGYITPPSITINPLAASGGSFGQISIGLANEEKPSLKDSFEVGENFLLTTNTSNFISTANSIPQDYLLISKNIPTFSSNNTNISKLDISSQGKITSISNGKIKLTNVKGIFKENSKIIGTTSGSTSLVSTSNSTFNAITINDKSSLSFKTPLQLTRLQGNFTSGSLPFIEDEFIVQESNISTNTPTGRLHHAEINAGTDDDILYISNVKGLFDTTNNKTISGLTSLATFDNITNKYTGDFVEDSGQLIYYENVDAIKRSGNKSEIIKIIFAL